MSRNIFKVDELLAQVAKKRSLRYNSYDRKPHWTMGLALKMKKKMSREDYKGWLNRYIAELDAKRRQKTD